MEAGHGSPVYKRPEENEELSHQPTPIHITSHHLFYFIISPTHNHIHKLSAMFPITALAALASLFLPILAAPSSSDKTLIYPSGLYSNADYPVDMLSCRSDLKGYKTLKDLPDYPFVGGAPWVNDQQDGVGANCISCWKFTYRHESYNFLLVDYADGGFRTSVAALRNLTGSDERVAAEMKRVSREDCRWVS